jgi:hypothetical protein
MIELGVERSHTQGSIDNEVEKSFELCNFQTRCSDHRRSLSLRLRLRVCEADRSSASSAEGKNVWSCHVPSVRRKAGLPLSNAGQANYGLTKTVTMHQYSGIRVPIRVCLFQMNHPEPLSEPYKEALCLLASRQRMLLYSVSCLFMICEETHSFSLLIYFLYRLPLFLLWSA